MYWLTRSWWAYLLERPLTLEKFLCRARGHKSVVWFNVCGLEPDMHCKGCGDDLG